MSKTVRPLPRWLLLISLAILLGCDEDKRLVALSRESLHRQAEQNQQMAEQTQTVAEATKQLVEAEAESARQTQELHRQLHTERQSVDRQQEDLEQERRQLAAARQREPIIAETIGGAVAILVAALPLVLCWYLVRTLFLSANDDVTAAELVIEQLATQGPLLEACTRHRLPPPTEPDAPSPQLPEPETLMLTSSDAPSS